MSNIFPKSANRLPLQIILFVFVLGGIATAGATYYMTPKYTRVGYAPVQPVVVPAESHKNTFLILTHHREKSEFSLYSFDIRGRYGTAERATLGRA